MLVQDGASEEGCLWGQGYIEIAPKKSIKNSRGHILTLKTHRPLLLTLIYPILRKRLTSKATFMLLYIQT